MSAHHFAIQCNSFSLFFFFFLSFFLSSFFISFLFLAPPPPPGNPPPPPPNTLEIIYQFLHISQKATSSEQRTRISRSCAVVTCSWRGRGSPRRRVSGSGPTRDVTRRSRISVSMVREGESCATIFDTMSKTGVEKCMPGSALSICVPYCRSQAQVLKQSFKSRFCSSSYIYI